MNHPAIRSLSQPNAEVPSTNTPSPARSLLVVTGASSNHHACLKHLLISMMTYEPGTPVVVYDLGLSVAERAEISGMAAELRRFPFERYPPHVDIRDNCGQYAWKPIIIDDLLREARTDILWLDAGNLVERPLTALRRDLAVHGVYSPVSSGTIAQWTHPGTLACMKVPPEMQLRRNRNAAIVGMGGGANAPALEICRRWRALALDPACIAPSGSTRNNHRYDQAILSILLYSLQQQFGYALPPRCEEITTHNDHREEAEIRAILRPGVPADDSAQLPFHSRAHRQPKCL